MPALLASLSAALFGVADFFGGLSARRIAAQWTTGIAQATGLLVIVATSLVVGGSPTGGDLALGAAAGLCGGLGLTLFYWAMAQGPMSVVAPVSALVSALVPITAGLLDGDRPGPLAVAGIVLALPAIAVISREPVDAVADGGTDQRARPSSLPVLAALLSGVGFGAFFTLISHTGDDSGVWPLAAARTAAVLLAMVLVLGARSEAPNVRGARLAALAGLTDSTANVFYLFAARQGLLSIVGVIGAMYPAATVVLARVVLKERLARHQLVGLGAAALAVTLIALA
ncbi:MAG: EamA family transporter [Microthrixaceae bacterium]